MTNICYLKFDNKTFDKNIHVKEHEPPLLKLPTEPAEEVIIDLKFDFKDYYVDRRYSDRVLIENINKTMNRFIMDIICLISEDHLPQWFKEAPKKINVEGRRLSYRDEVITNLEVKLKNGSFTMGIDFDICMLTIDDFVEGNIVELNFSLNRIPVIINYVSNEKGYNHDIQINYNLKGCCIFLLPSPYQQLPTDVIEKSILLDNSFDRCSSYIGYQHVVAVNFYPYDLQINLDNESQLRIINYFDSYQYDGSVNLKFTKPTKSTHDYRIRLTKQYDTLFSEIYNLSEQSQDFNHDPYFKISLDNCSLKFYIDFNSPTELEIAVSVLSTIKNIGIQLVDFTSVILNSLRYFNQNPSSVLLRKGDFKKRLQLYSLALSLNTIVLEDTKFIDIFGRRMKDIHFHIQNANNYNFHLVNEFLVSIREIYEFYNADRLLLTPDNSTITEDCTEFFKVQIVQGINLINNTHVTIPQISTVPNNLVTDISVFFTVYKEHGQNLNGTEIDGFVLYYKGINCDETSTFTVFPIIEQIAFTSSDFTTSDYCMYIAYNNWFDPFVAIDAVISKLTNSTDLSPLGEFIDMHEWLPIHKSITDHIPSALTSSGLNPIQTTELLTQHSTQTTEFLTQHPTQTTELLTQHPTGSLTQLLSKLNVNKF